MRRYAFFVCAFVLLVSVVTVWAIGEDTGTATPSPTVPSGDYSATITNDQGGPVRITGVLPITNVNVKKSTMSPVIILEDQVNFVSRDVLAPLPENSQVLAHFTTDFYAEAPVGYEVFLPSVPGGSYVDVDNNASTDQGVQIYQIAYWDNRFGDLYLDNLDAYGWSSAYSSAKVDDDPRQLGELIGGKLIVFAGSEGQGFPTEFGADGKLFTGDEPIETLPIGWTIVDLDTQPFTFDRSREPVIDLIEPDSLVLDDYSDMSYTDAFDALVAKGRTEYAFTDYKSLDWDALSAQFRPQFEAADRSNDQSAYFEAIDNFARAIPDGHVAAYGGSVGDARREAIQGSIGIGVRELTDGRILVNYVSANSPAERAGIQVGTEIIAINGTPIDDYIDQVDPFFGPYSNEEQRRLGQVVFATRFYLGDSVELTYKNVGSSSEQNATLQTISEFDSIQFELDLVYGSSNSGLESPAEFSFTDEGFGLVEINTFDGYESLIVQNWDYFINLANDSGAPAIIVDLRTNSGGFSFIGNRLAATLYDEEFVLYNTESYAKEIGDFYTDPRFPDRIIIDPNAPHYDGKVVVLVGPSCASACEFFAYALTRNNRAEVIGQYGSYAIGGGWSPTYLPDGVEFALPTNRKIAPDGTIVVEGTGIQPTIRVPVTEENMASTDDFVLQAAIDYLNK